MPSVYLNEGTGTGNGRQAYMPTILFISLNISPACCIFHPNIYTRLGIYFEWDIGCVMVWFFGLVRRGHEHVV